MSRKNNKEQLVTYDNSIKKSNELSMSKLSQGLTLNQMQLLAYSIYATQHDGKTEFRKFEFQDKFGIEKYQTTHAKEDVKKLMGLQFSIEDLDNNYFEYWNIFGSIKYKEGVFNFRWNEEFIPHILELKTYSLIDLTITSKFKSGFSWTLYEFLKAHYGNWHKELSKDALMKLFGVEDRKSYQRSTAEFKRSVLDLAIEEINAHTELEVWYTEKKVGNKITGFVLHWSTGNRVAGATDKQIRLLKEISEEVEKNMLDYLSIKNIETARDYIIKIKEMNFLIKKGLSAKKASEYIKESIEYYRMLENLLEVDGAKRDTSIYFNWLKDIE